MANIFPGIHALRSMRITNCRRSRISRAEMDAHELAVFRHFGSGPDAVDAMMIGHAFYPALDSSGVPSSLSRRVVTDLLRTEHGFRGLVMTDDLDMGAILEPYGRDAAGLAQVIRLAIEAGNDLAMICHRVELVEKAIEALAKVPRVELDRALANVAATKARLVEPDPFDEAEFRRRDAEVWDLRVATLGAARAAERSAEDGKRSPVELYLSVTNEVRCATTSIWAVWGNMSIGVTEASRKLFVRSARSRARVAGLHET